MKVKREARLRGDHNTLDKDAQIRVRAMRVYILQ